MPDVGKGVREIRVRDESGAYRVIYVATFDDRDLRASCVSEEDAEDRPARPGTGEGQISRVAIMTKAQNFANVWDAIEATPEEAAVMTARSDIMTAFEDTVREWNVTQRQAARRLGVTQPRLNDLLNGDISKFSLDALMSLAQRAGIKVRIAAEKV
jgi:predicted XRE-type DNA-binding protein